MQITEHFRKLFVEDHNALSDILGQDHTKKQLMSALMMGRHVIVLGEPGIGKTTLARNVAKLLPVMTVNDCSYHCQPKQPLCPECKQTEKEGKKIKTKKISGEHRFVRVQGSPDLTAEDLLGDIDPIKAIDYGPLSVESFTPGKIFKANNGVLFFDEVNRCPEKLQNALLQVLSEGKATIGSYSVDLPANFIFIGTMNPEDNSTEPLSDVFLDRFDVVYMAYPETEDVELRIVETSGAQLDVAFLPSLIRLAVSFVRSLRSDKKLEKKPSVRASIGLYERAQSNAVLHNHKKVMFEDVLSAVISVLSHRIRLTPSEQYVQKPTEYIASAFKQYAEEFKEQQEKAGGEG